MTTLAQLMQQDEDNRNRYRQALDMLLEAEREVDQLIADLKEAQAEYAKERERLKTEMAQLRASRRQGSSETRSEKSKEGDAGNAVAKGKGKEKEQEASDSPELDLDEDDEGIPRNPAGDAHRAKGLFLNARMRVVRIALHKIKFLQGDVYHVLGKSYEDAENEAYAAAEELRRTLLRGQYFQNRWLKLEC